MPRREEIPNGILGSAREQVTSPLDLEEMLPGAPPDYVPGARPWPQSAIDAKLADAQSTVEALADKLADRFNAAISEVIPVKTELAGRMEGEYVNLVNEINGTADKLRGKMVQRAADKLSEAIGLASTFGYVPPGIDEAIADNQLQPPTQEPEYPVFPPLPPADDGGYIPPEPPTQPPLPPPQKPGPGLPPGVSPPPPGDFIPGIPFPPIFKPPFWYSDERCATDTQVRPANWDGSQLWNGAIMPDWCGNCPSGYCNNGGTGTFFNACVPIGPGVCQSGPQPPQPPQPPPEQPPKPPQPPVGGDKCPVPDWLQCAADVIQVVQQQAQGDDYCDKIVSAIAHYAADPLRYDKIIDMSSGEGTTNPIAAAIGRILLGSAQPIIPQLVKRFGDWVEQQINAVVIPQTCEVTPEAKAAAQTWTALQFINRFVPLASPTMMQEANHCLNWNCQNVMPDQQSADRAYLADVINKETWRCWTKLNGNVLDAAEKGYETLRTRPTPLQLTQLYRREQLSESEWKERIRQDGVIKDVDRQAFYDLTQDWPTASELTPWLVRDVWDETNIDWTKHDKLFKDKYTKDSRKYFNAIGWTEELAKLHWRAHFHLPSFTMASEMYHRYRNLDPNDPLHTDKKKVEALLIQDDWDPNWTERMLAITFRPMRLIDLRNSYDMRTISDEDLQERLQWLGYDDKTIQLTFTYWQRRRDIRDAQKAGFPSVKTLVKQYANCYVDPSTFRLVLSRIVETPEQEQLAVEYAEIARETEANRRTISGVEWQYRRGLISEAEATEHLSRGGIDPTCIPTLVELWKQRIAKTPKQLTASQLCKMREYAIITTEEMVMALVRAGWSPLDAQRITAECTARLTDKAMRKANAEANRIAREMRRIEREERRRQRLLECGEPPCPANRSTPSQNGQGGQSTPGQT